MEISKVNATRLSSIEARCEIRNLLARVAHLSDSGDLADYIEMFTEDVCWAIDGEEIHGRSAMAAASSRRRAARQTGPGSGTLHLVSTMVIDLLDDARARAESTFQFCRKEAPGVSIVLCGVYYDNLVLTTEGWRIAERRLRTI